MSDHIAAVQAQAEKQALKLFPDDSWRRNEERSAYVEGQVALASRLTRKKIAIALAKQKARDWDSMSGVLHIAAIHTEYPNADAVLALLVDDTQR